MIRELFDKSFCKKIETMTVDPKQNNHLTAVDDICHSIILANSIYHYIYKEI